MLKQGDSRLMPQTLPKEQRRVNGDRQHRSRYRLGHVVVIREFCGVTLEVDLKTRIARFHHDVVVRQVQLVETFNVNR